MNFEVNKILFKTPQKYLIPLVYHNYRTKNTSIVNK